MSVQEYKHPRFIKFYYYLVSKRIQQFENLVINLNKLKIYKYKFNYYFEALAGYTDRINLQSCYNYYILIHYC
jgi:hypothetical protein